MTNNEYSDLRLSLSERLPIVTYANRFCPDPETVWMSPQVERITGYRVDEWVGDDTFFESVLHPEDREHVLCEVHASRADLRPFSRDYRLLARDGRVVWIHDESVPMLDALGRPELIQGYFIDITDRKALEEELLHAQKNEALGQLASGIAHDFNNYLTAIRGYAELVERALQPGEPAYSYLGEVIRTTQHASNLTRQLLAFSRQEAIQPQDVRIDAIVDGLQLMLSQVAGRDALLSFELEPTPVVRADAGQIEQVVVNLISNARDAMPGGGQVSIRTETAAVTQGLESRRLGIAPGEYAALVVSDTGAGMDEATRKRIFDPFFSTKPPAQGTGLGLSILDRIVRQSGGAVDVTTFAGRGTTFRVLIPAAATEQTRVA